MNDLILLTVSIFSLGLGYLTIKVKQYYVFSGLFIGVLLISIYLNNPKMNLLFYLGTYLSGILFSFLHLKNLEKLNKDPDIIALDTTRGTKYLKGASNGVSIFGASGSGKTESAICTCLRHYIVKHNLSGYVFDFKDGELVEMALGMKEGLAVFCPHNTNISVRINVLANKYIKKNIDVIQVAKVLTQTLIKQEEQKNNFFVEGAEGLFSGLITKLKLDHPQYCTLPHIIGFILAVDLKIQYKKHTDPYGLLTAFLKENIKAEMQAKTFIFGRDAKEQTAGLISSLANGFRKLVDEDLFWVLSKDEYDLQLNKSNGNVFCFMTKPKNHLALSPIVSSVTNAIFTQMMERGGKKAFILLDEASTIRLDFMGLVTATMRSFGIATIYCCQDMIQGYQQYGRDGFKAIISNLSTQFFGKTNDPDTAKFYESFYPLKKSKSKSRTAGSGKSSTTTSEREVAEHRAQEFMRLKQGEFGFVNEGKAQILRFNKPIIEKKQIPIISNVTEKEKDENFHKIINDMRLLADNIIT